MTTDKFNLFDVGVGTSGWDSILDSNMEKIDDAIPSRHILEAGENISAYEAVYVKSDGKLWKAQADGTKQPCFGVMIEAATAAESKRCQTWGEVTNGSWTWTIGAYVYLDASTAGALTQTAPSANAQIIGIATAATKLFVMINITEVRPLQIGGTYNGSPTASLHLTKLPISGNASFASGMSSSHMYAGTTATATTTFSLRKIDSDQTDAEFGTVVFEPDTTIDNAAAVDKGGGEVGIPITGHGLSAGQKIILSGTTNYDGTHEIQSQTANEVVIEATYAAETFAGTENVLMNWGLFASASGETFVDGDLLVLRAPASPDATLADLGWNLIGTRS